MIIRKEWSSHLPVLYRIMPFVKGPILELGIGFYSTPFLHWVCQDRGLLLESFEKEPKYFRYFRSFRNINHHLILVEDWDKIDIDKHWGLAFIDHNAERRNIEAIRLADKADYVIIHDTQDETNDAYSLDKVYPHYKYRKDFNQFSPRTTILSNFYEVKDI